MNIDYEKLGEVLVTKAEIGDNQICNEKEIIDAVITASGLLEEVERLKGELSASTTCNDITQNDAERDRLQIENQRLMAKVRRVEEMADGWMVACLLHEADHKSYSVDRDRMKWCAEKLTAALKGDQ